MNKDKKNISNSLKKFIDKNNFQIEYLIHLKSDASNRKYYRLKHDYNKILIMDSSLEIQSANNFLKLSRWLLKNNYSVPNIFKSDKINGILIIEDFGESKFSNILNNNKSKVFYYKKAIDLLIDLSNKKPPSFLSKYNENILMKELKIFLEYYIFYKKKKKNNSLLEWQNIWKKLFNFINLEDSCLVLRDYHIDNIFYLKKRSKIKKIGLIDFQDALLGHYCYDLVSLLQDVRTFISFKDQDFLLNYYLNKSNVCTESFKRAYLILGTQRLIKIIGIFNRLKNKKQNKTYLKYLPRAWKLLNYNLKNPILNELKIWINNNN